MAKFARIGYGHDGRGSGDGNGYTYLVSDTIRTGDNLQPAVRHYKSGKIFATTGMVLRTHGENTKVGQELKTEVQSKGFTEPTRAYQGKELGISGRGYKSSTRGGNIEKALQQGNVCYSGVSEGEKTQQAIQDYNYESYDKYVKRHFGD